MNRNELIKQLDWLRDKVLVGYQTVPKMPPGIRAEAIRRTELHIADIEWLLEDLTRKAPICGWNKPYAEHDPNCHYCKTGKLNIKGNPAALKQARMKREQD